MLIDLPRDKFLKSKKCKVLVAIGVLLACGIIALLTTSYVIAATATTTTTTTAEAGIP